LAVKVDGPLVVGRVFQDFGGERKLLPFVGLQVEVTVRSKAHVRHQEVVLLALRVEGFEPDSAFDLRGARDELLAAHSSTVIGDADRRVFSNRATFNDLDVATGSVERVVGSESLRRTADCDHHVADRANAGRVQRSDAQLVDVALLHADERFSLRRSRSLRDNRLRPKEEQTKVFVVDVIQKKVAGHIDRKHHRLVLDADTSVRREVVEFFLIDGNREAARITDVAPARRGVGAAVKGRYIDLSATEGLVAEIQRHLRRGRNVYTNVAITDVKFAQKYKDRLFSIDSLEDIVDLREGEIVLDEVHIYLNSRNWDKLDVRFQLFLQQHRKRGLNITGAVQSVKRADVVFRELIQVFYRIKKLVSFKIPYWGKAFGFFYLREYDPDYVESGGVKVNQQAIGWPWLFLADPFIFALYDTTQEYLPTERIGSRVIKEYVVVRKTIEENQLMSTKTLPIQSG